MAYIRCDFKSDLLDMNTSMVVLIPDEIEDITKARIVYLFHGLSDNCTGWIRYTSVERYAREYGVVVVMPEVQRSFYTDMKYGIKYFSFVHDELPNICSKFFGLSRLPGKTYVMGLSMGGYGALKCLLNTPERYGGAASFSAVTDMKKWFARADACGYENELKSLFGHNLQIPLESDLLSLAKTLTYVNFPKIYMACGKQDELFSDTDKLAKIFKENKADVVYENWDGMHDWKFWDEALKKSFEYFFLR